MNPKAKKQIADIKKRIRAHGEAPADVPPPADGRLRTSAAKRGKDKPPKPDWGMLAKSFQAQTGRVFYRGGTFFRYDASRGAYAALSEGAMGQQVAGFLCSGGGGLAVPVYSSAAERNLVGALRAGDCSPEALDPKLLPPVWLSTREPAGNWVAMENGLLDLEAAARGGKDALRPYTSAFFSTRTAPFAWDPDAPCPKFEAALAQWLPDPDAQAMLQMLAGLLLVPDTSFEKAFILAGVPGSGRSTFSKILIALLGEENVSNLRLEFFGEKHLLSPLTQTLANVVMDSKTTDSAQRAMQANAGMIEGVMKSVVSGDRIHCEPKFHDATFAPATARLVFCMNYPLPRIIDTSGAMGDRLRIIVFPRKFRDTADDRKDLAAEIIREELAGVFAWAVDGLGMLRKAGKFPDQGKGAAVRADLLAESDRESQFLRERYIESEGGYLPSREVFSAYKTWCMENNYGAKNMGNFRQELLRVFPAAEWPLNAVRLSDSSRIHIIRNIVRDPLAPTDSGGTEHAV